MEKYERQCKFLDRKHYIDLWRWQQLRDGPVQHGGQQSVAKDLSKVLGHDCLLLHTAVIFNRKDDWEVWCL